MDEVVFAIEKHMEEEKVNFGELDKEEDLWALVDRVSNEQGGWPDSLSKVALLTVLDRKLALESVGWLRTHLDDLIRMWKRVVKSETNFTRPGQAVLAAPSYSPPMESRRRGGNKNRRTLVGMMSVGALLNTARTRFMTEDGELEIDEDEFGRTTIGGATLDWVSWGALSGSANVPQEEEKKKTDSPQPAEQDEQQMLRRKRAGWQKERRKGAYKIRRLAFQRREQEEANENETRPRPQKTDQSIPVAKKEREEGEMSDQSSSSSSSSSDASDGEEKTKPAGHRQRRRQMRQMKVRPETNNIQSQPQPQQQNVMMQQMLNFCQQFYDSRAGIVRQLSEEQKTALMTAMQQMQTMAQPFSVHQQQQMMDMMKSFMAQYHTPYHF